ncbi:MAG: calcium-binding protein, partial [Desulfobacterales bacterium]|nr:calcium-binding protein [Desulfobacterales bacterium]
AVYGFTVGDVTVTGGTKAGSFASGVDGSTVYTLVVTPDADSTANITVDVAANVATDAAGNNNTAATQSVQAVDTEVPTVVITDDTGGTATGDVTYTFTFNEAVYGFTVGDVTVTGGTKAANFATGVDGSTVYTLVVTPDADSTTNITVDVAANVATDAVGHDNTAATQSVQAVDTIVPTVDITDNTGGTATGDVTYTFTFSEAVYGFTVGDVTVTGGTKAGSFASGVDGSTVYTLVVTPDAD